MEPGPALAEFFSTRAPLGARQRILVAFSGGADSTALLVVLDDLARSRGFEVHAAHVDHGLDPDACRRADHARRVSNRLSIPFHLLRPILDEGGALGPEASARRARYTALEQLRKTLGARYLVTAHHRDDQAETVALRIAFGSGLGGLAGIQPVHRRILRPFLNVPRHALLEEVRRRGLPFVSDPTNLDLERPRNLLRHHLLPALESREPTLSCNLAGLASVSRRARSHWSRILSDNLQPRPVEAGWGFSLEPFRKLPEELQDLALDLLHRLAGNPYPAPSAARLELRRQLQEGLRIGVDCGARLRWERRGKLLVVVPHATPTPFFSYTLQVPGEVRIAEVGRTFRIFPAAKPGPAVPPCMAVRSSKAPGLSGATQRAIFGTALITGETITLRNRQPGDKAALAGAKKPRPLKDLLSTHRIPFRQRDRLLLVSARDIIIWVPGLGLDERFRPSSEGSSWLAETSAHEQ